MGWNNKYTVVHGSNLHGIPIIGWVMKKWLTPVNRSDRGTYIPLITEMKEYLLRKINVLIFIEGGRITEEERENGILLKQFKNGAFKVADQIGCVIVPVTIRGAYEFKPKASRRWWLRPGLIEIIYHNSIEPIGKIDDVIEKTRQVIMSEL
jgi:1-acyl-sn-glycerol-3-phosphate acyltransferase